MRESLARCAVVALVVLVTTGAARAQTAPTTALTGDLSYVSVSGNTRLRTLSLGEKLVRTDGRLVLSQLAAYLRGKTDSTETANQLRAAGRADVAFNPRLGAFVGVSYDRNRYAGFTRRLDEIAGVRWKAIVAPSDSLSVDGGAVLTQQRNVDGTSDNYPSARVAAAYRHLFSKTTYLAQLTEYIPNLETSGAYRVNNDLSLVAPLSTHLSIKNTYTVRYDSRPPAGFRTTDRIVTMGMQFSF